MTERTDDELVNLVRATFVAAEPLADLAHDETRRGRRPWVPILAAAASMVLAIGAAWTIARQHDPNAAATGSATHVTATPGPARTYADNRRAAAAAADQLIAQAPLPDGAIRIPGKPSGWPEGEMTLAPADIAFYREAWYSVDLDADQVEAYLLSHLPAGTTIEGRDGEAHSGVGGGSDGVRDVTYNATASSAFYTSPALLVQWRDMGSTTALEFGTYVSARTVRDNSTLVTGDVTSVQVSRVVEDQGTYTNYTPPPDVHLRITDEDDVATLADDVNALYGSIDPPMTASCPAALAPQTYSLVFHTASRDWTFSVRPDCWGQVQVSSDDLGKERTLDPGNLTDQIDALIKAQKP